MIDAKLNNALCSGALECLPTGIVILDRRGRILVENEAARKIFREGSILRVREGHLNAVDMNCNAQLTKQITDATNPIVGESGAMLLADANGSRLSMVVTPAAQSFCDETGAGALVFLADLDSNRKRDLAGRLINLFGLTPNEAKIANLLANGLPAKEVAELSGNTYETTRSIMKSIFSKTGVNRQAELVALIHAAVPIEVE